jgi:hypothetical protein
VNRETFIADLRQLVIDRVPFKHGGRDPYNGGLDCMYSPVWAAKNQSRELPPEIEDPPPYFEKAHRCELIEETLRKYFVEISLGEASTADLYLFRIGSRQRHIGIQVTDTYPPLLFHMSSRPLNRAVEMPLSEQWRRRVIGVFRFPEFHCASDSYLT